VVLSSWAWLVLPPSAARAEPRAEAPRLSFAWNAPGSCPTRGDVLTRVERLLGHPASANLAAPLTIEANVTELGAESWELRLASGDPRAEPRRVTAASCAELAEMAAVFTALSIDPTLNVGAPDVETNVRPKEETAAPPGSEVAPPTASPVPRPANSSERSAPLQPPLVVARPARHGLRPVVALFGALGWGRLPGTAPGFGVEGGVAQGRLGFRAELADFPERHAAATSTSGGDLSLAVTGARAVYELTEGATLLALSAGITLGWLRGTGTGVTRPESGNALLLALEPGARAGYALSRSLALVADARLVVAVNRPRFVLAGRELYQPAWLGAQLGLSAEWCPR